VLYRTINCRENLTQNEAREERYSRIRTLD